jgi:hypothetical protein
MLLGCAIEVLSRSSRSDEDDVQRSRSKNYERWILEKMRVWEDKIECVIQSFRNRGWSREEAI